MRFSLSSRLLLISALSLLLISAAGFVAMTAVQKTGTDFFLEDELARNARRLAYAMHFDAAGQLDSVTTETRDKTVFEALPQDFFFRVLDGGGRVLLSTDEASVALAPDGAVFDPALRRFEVVRAGQLLHVITAATEHAGAPYYVQLARSERFQQAMLRNDLGNAKKVALLAFVLAMLVFSVVVGLTFRRVLRPLRDVSQAAARIEPGNLTARLPTAAMPNELVPLITAFNQALERIEHGYRTQQEFLATAAHELKTPLALMRGQIELDGCADRALLLKDVDHMARQVHQLLHLAEVSEPQNYVFGTVDALAVAADVAAHLERLAARRGVAIEIDSPDAVMAIRADRGALFVLLKNLLENAIYHAPDGSTVLLALGAGQLLVRDHGQGIGEADLPMLFRRFWRGAHRRDDGAGLGLAICREIAVAHGWTCEARDAGPGAEFRLGGLVGA